MPSSPEPHYKKLKDLSSKKRKPHTEIAVDLSLPEPPSKKTKRALKKGKSLPPSSTNGNSSNKAAILDANGDRKTADGKTRSEKRSEHGVWIGNLSFRTTRESLTAFLVANSGGSITEANITRLKIPMNKLAEKDQDVQSSRAGKVGNKGFAYVDFDSKSAMYAAMGLGESELEGRKLLIKDARNFEGRPAVAKSSASANGEDNEVGADGNASAGHAEKKRATRAVAGTGSKKIFVGNLPYQVTGDDLRANFEKCGEINWVKVATFEDSGNCKGYGWVSFREEESAKSAVRGFVRVPEKELWVEDFGDEEAVAAKPAKDDASEGDGDKKPPSKKTKLQKRWVNRILGRDLKIEIAEDDQTRYSKRFGKAARKGRDGHSCGGRDNDRARDAQPQRKRNEAYAEEKVYAENGDGYRTGGIVESKGTKITFD